MIYVRDVEGDAVVPLTLEQEQGTPPDDEHVFLRNIPAGKTPLEIAKAWCDFWNGRGYRYEPMTEDGWTPPLFKEIKEIKEN